MEEKDPDVESGESAVSTAPENSFTGSNVEIDEAEFSLAGGAETKGNGEAGEYTAVDGANSGSDPQFIEQMRRQADTQAQAPSVPEFKYKYTSEDEYRLEMDDWYDYKDNWLLNEEVSVSREIMGYDWSNQSESHKKATITQLCESIMELSSKSSCFDSGSVVLDKLYDALLVLCYISQGSFAESTSLDHHIKMISANNTLLLHSGVYTVIFQLFIKIVDIKVPTEFTYDESNRAIGTKCDTVLLLSLTIIFSMVNTLKSEPEMITTLSTMSPNILDYLLDVFSRLRWVSEPEAVLPFRKLVMLLWKCILCSFGDHEQLARAKKARRLQYGLKDDEDEYEKNVDLVTASPLDYHAFREDVISRYPSYVPPPSVVPEGLENATSLTHFIEVSRPSHAQPSNAQLPAPTVHLATPVPSPPLSPVVMSGQKLKKSVFMTNQSFPFLFPSASGEVPKSTKEAAELFSSRVRMTPSMQQLWDERNKFMRYERGWNHWEDEQDEDNVTSEVGSDPTSIESRLARVENFYENNYSKLYSFVNVMLKSILQNIIFTQGGEIPTVDSQSSQGDNESSGGGIDHDPVSIRSKELVVKSISAILDLLTSWFKASHILKFEFLAAVLFDTRYYLLVYKYLYSHSVIDRALGIPDSLKQNFFTVCKDLSGNAINTNYGQTACRNAPPMTSSDIFMAERIEPFSRRYFFTMINLTRVLKRIIKKKVQRIVMVAELPSDSLKKALSVHQEDLWRVVLEIFKEQIPFNGKKWKYSNMNIISWIYLHCRAKLRDEWLSRSDVSAELDDAYAQEVAIRALVQFYNERKYASPDGFEGLSLSADL